LDLFSSDDPPDLALMSELDFSWESPLLVLPSAGPDGTEVSG